VIRGHRCRTSAFVCTRADVEPRGD